MTLRRGQITHLGLNGVDTRNWPVVLPLNSHYFVPFDDSLADATVIETRIGFRPFGPTARPVIGRVPGIDGLILGNGLAATGLTIGPWCGKLVADLALGRTPEMDLTPFAPR